MTKWQCSAPLENVQNNLEVFIKYKDSDFRCSFWIFFKLLHAFLKKISITKSDR